MFEFNSSCKRISYFTFSTFDVFSIFRFSRKKNSNSNILFLNFNLISNYKSLSNFVRTTNFFIRILASINENKISTNKSIANVHKQN